jgi:hypothetical protein
VKPETQWYLVEALANTRAEARGDEDYCIKPSSREPSFTSGSILSLARQAS